MKSTTINLISILIAIIFVVGAVAYSRNNSGPLEIRIDSFVGSVDNVKTENGKQIIEISARGGYSPRKTIAKAGVPTIIRFNTNSTFDCSSNVLIPSMGIKKNLPSSGVIDIDIGIPSANKLGVTCGMGMYSFGIEFE